MLVRSTVVVISLWLIAPGASAEQRPPLKGVSVVRIANYGAPSVLVERQQVRAIVEELNRLRNRDWRRGDTKLSCYSTIVLLQGTKKVAEFRVGLDHIVERPVEKGQSIGSLAIDRADLSVLARLLAEIPAAKNCD